MSLGDQHAGQRIPAYVASAADLSLAISERIDRVEELKFAGEEAARLGIRAFLFGGGAAAYAHYVNGDLRRELAIKLQAALMHKYGSKSAFEVRLLRDGMGDRSRRP